ncbi:MAG: Isochorismatase family protein [Syntrophorhabdus sp. PtaU1.Bin002]|nr:MAG: Isochorismatase family protein [Syntrophorhabdus sp. PtaB.Bin006]OPY71569.1 MAG: Isochorismatase family protein [Syntrophorhabdus sp. PtaU1.Bin002]
MEKISVPKPALLERDDCALVVIDVQEKLLPVIAGHQGVLQNVLRLMRFCRIAGIPIIVTEQEKLGPSVHQVEKEAAAVPTMQKVHFNCFLSEDFAHILETVRRNTLILAGVEAHICVAQTALYALPRFNVHAVADAVGSRTADNRQIALQRMRQAGATITSTEMFIYEVLQRAGTEEFKAALQLVK